MSPDHLEEAVDRTVREIMGGEPADDLARRVLREISVPSSSWRNRPLTLALAACLLLLAVATPRVLREWRSDSSAQLVSARVGTPVTRELAPAAPPGAVSEHARGSSGPAIDADLTKETSSASLRRVTTANSPISRQALAESPQLIADARGMEGASVLEPWPVEAVAVEQLGAISPITVAPVTQAPLRIEEIAIEPLEIEPLQVDPLSSATQQ